ncbi:MAG: hypothetical protein ACP5G0_11440 [Desulfomonilia bacterium]
MRKHVVLFVIIIFFSTVPLSAKEYPYIYKGIRPMGMGGAFVALSNDANALFYNPAGLADIKERQISFFPLELEVGQNAYDIYDDALDVDFDNEQETADFLRKYIGDYAHASASFFPYYARPNFALGIIASGKANFLARDRQYPRMITEIIEDAGICAGYAHPLLDEKLLIGASLKYLFRRSLNEEYTVVDITSGDFDSTLRDDFEDGNNVLLDIGMIYKKKDFKVGDKYFDFHMGISANNLIGNKLGDARDIDDHIDLGFAVVFKSFSATLDYVDLFNQVGEDEDVGKRLRLGAEYRFPKYASVRGGFYQGYPTLGISFKLKIIQLDLLTYAEEVGAYSGQRDDRRYVLGLSFGL